MTILLPLAVLADAAPEAEIKAADKPLPSKTRRDKSSLRALIAMPIAFGIQGSSAPMSALALGFLRALSPAAFPLTPTTPKLAQERAAR